MNIAKSDHRLSGLMPFPDDCFHAFDDGGCEVIVKARADEVSVKTCLDEVSLDVKLGNTDAIQWRGSLGDLARLIRAGITGTSETSVQKALIPSDYRPLNPNNVPPEEIPEGMRLIKPHEATGDWFPGAMWWREDHSHKPRFERLPRFDSYGAWLETGKTIVVPDRIFPTVVIEGRPRIASVSNIRSVCALPPDNSYIEGTVLVVCGLSLQSVQVRLCPTGVWTDKNNL